MLSLASGETKTQALNSIMVYLNDQRVYNSYDLINYLLIHHEEAVTHYGEKFSQILRVYAAVPKALVFAKGLMEETGSNFADILDAKKEIKQLYKIFPLPQHRGAFLRVLEGMKDYDGPGTIIWEFYVQNNMTAIQKVFNLSRGDLPYLLRAMNIYTGEVEEAFEGLYVLMCKVNTLMHAKDIIKDSPIPGDRDRDTNTVTDNVSANAAVCSSATACGAGSEVTGGVSESKSSSENSEDYLRAVREAVKRAMLYSRRVVSFRERVVNSKKGVELPAPLSSGDAGYAPMERTANVESSHVERVREQRNSLPGMGGRG
jgi:hypothetical protein